METLSTEVSLTRVAINYAELCDDLERAASLPAGETAQGLKHKCQMFHSFSPSDFMQIP